MYHHIWLSCELFGVCKQLLKRAWTRKAQMTFLCQSDADVIPECISMVVKSDSLGCAGKVMQVFPL